MTLEILSYLLAAAVQLSGLPPIPVADLPPVVVMPRQEMYVHLCLTGSCPRTEHLADFIPSQYAIVYLDSLNPEGNEIDASFLVHELVHVLQFHQDRKAFVACADFLAAEKQAYRVQNAYLRQQGQFYIAGAQMRGASCHG
jgi:hypothetical protein